MTCPRCNGLFVRIDIEDWEGVYEGCRCVNCGHYTDTMMERNRAMVQNGFDHEAQHNVPIATRRI